MITKSGLFSAIFGGLLAAALVFTLLVAGFAHFMDDYQRRPSKLTENVEEPVQDKEYVPSKYYDIWIGRSDVSPVVLRGYRMLGPFSEFGTDEALSEYGGGKWLVLESVDGRRAYLGRYTSILALEEHKPHDDPN